MSEDVLQLIIIDDSSNDAETISNMLRNAGTAVRTERVEDDEDLRAQLGAHPWDMILTKPGITYLSAAEAIAVVRQLGQDIPLIVIADGADEEGIAELSLLKNIWIEPRRGKPAERRRRKATDLSPKRV